MTFSSSQKNSSNFVQSADSNALNSVDNDANSDQISPSAPSTLSPVFFPPVEDNRDPVTVYREESIECIQAAIHRLKWMFFDKNRNQKIRYLKLILQEQERTQDPSFRHCINAVNKKHPDLKEVYDSLSKHDDTWQVLAEAQQYDISETTINSSDEFSLTEAEKTELDKTLSPKWR